MEGTASASGLLSAGVVVSVSLLYVALLFGLAFFSDRRARSGRPGFLSSPVVYTLSISVYCTSWTFYGAVGSAARGGIEYLPIYLGPSLVFVGWWYLLRKLVRISKTHRITSIADFVSSRFGKSNRLAVIVTLFAVIGTTPYIALQLKAVSSTFVAVSQIEGASQVGGFGMFADTALWVAVAMAVFAILFGTRSTGADEHHPGIIAAIAFESIVKLLALLSVGILVVFVLGPGSDGVFARATSGETDLSELWTVNEQFGPRWVTLMFLSGAAIICLPRQFQVSVVEVSNERHLSTAAWLFPLYLFLISLFIIPIALAGRTLLPVDANPDLFVLTVPIATGHDWLALFAFIGGFSSATSMVIVSSIALSIMLSNHVVMPILLALKGVQSTQRGGLTGTILWVRRGSIIAIFALALVYDRISAPEGLASIGLISFTAVAQFLPVLVGGLYWRSATEKGALAGLIAGFAIWAYTLFLPSLFGATPFFAALIQDGPWGITLLRPNALFGAEGWDPLVHALSWSYVGNIAAFVGVSLMTAMRPLERLQSALFIDAFHQSPAHESQAWRQEVPADDLYSLTQRVLGHEAAFRIFQDYAHDHGERADSLADTDLVAHVERVLAGNIGAASARVLVSGVAQGESISLAEVIEILDETQQAIEYSHQLEAQSAELESTAAQLRQANEQLKRLDKQKDDFLSRVSHELRTPMTSIRSFSEILMEHDDISDDQKSRNIRTIAKESRRLTGLLDEILDLAAMTDGHGVWRIEDVDARQVLSDAVDTIDALAARRGVHVEANFDGPPVIMQLDRDRIMQVFVNLLSNAVKFNTSADPVVRINTQVDDEFFCVEFVDNGPGIPPVDQELVFSKFARSTMPAREMAGSGLGLSISQEIARHFGGWIDLHSVEGEGATFTVRLPRG